MNKETDNSDQVFEVGSDDPTLLLEVGSRIDEVSRAIGSRIDAASVAEISTDQLVKYTKGRSPRLGFMPIARLCDAAGYRMEWVWTGKGPKKQADMAVDGSGEYRVRVPLDRTLLRDVIEVLEELVQEKGLALTPDKKAELILLLYEEIVDQELQDQDIDRHKVLRLINLAS